MAENSMRARATLGSLFFLLLPWIASAQSEFNDRVFALGKDVLLVHLRMGGPEARVYQRDSVVDLTAETRVKFREAFELSDYDISSIQVIGGALEKDSGVYLSRRKTPVSRPVYFTAREASSDASLPIECLLISDEPALNSVPGSLYLHVDKSIALAGVVMTLERNRYVLAGNMKYSEYESESGTFPLKGGKGVRVSSLKLRINESGRALVRFVRLNFANGKTYEFPALNDRTLDRNSEFEIVVPPALASLRVQSITVRARGRDSSDARIRVFYLPSS